VEKGLLDNLCFQKTNNLKQFLEDLEKRMDTTTLKLE